MLFKSELLNYLSMSTVKEGTAKEAVEEAELWTSEQPPWGKDVKETFGIAGKRCGKKQAGSIEKRRPCTSVNPVEGFFSTSPLCRKK